MIDCSSLDGTWFSLRDAAVASYGNRLLFGRQLSSAVESLDRIPTAEFGGCRYDCLRQVQVAACLYLDVTRIVAKDIQSLIRMIKGCVIISCNVAYLPHKNLIKIASTCGLRCKSSCLALAPVMRCSWYDLARPATRYFKAFDDLLSTWLSVPSPRSP